MKFYNKMNVNVNDNRNKKKVDCIRWQRQIMVRK